MPCRHMKKADGFNKDRRHPIFKGPAGRFSNQFVICSRATPKSCRATQGPRREVPGHQESVMRILVLSPHAATFLLVGWCFPFVVAEWHDHREAQTHHVSVGQRLLRITSVEIDYQELVLAPGIICPKVWMRGFAPPQLEKRGEPLEVLEAMAYQLMGMGVLFEPLKKLLDNLGLCLDLANVLSFSPPYPRWT
ncbi:hypothetical protein EV702DRAFT_1043327 [Suillus placidus]|uniref:Uncharacterized protein n=1 Tax=Suillus placidus TaxID=48579 RepID=A0A9P7A0F9_9AGAM|nr:hypothetical protein EV702DRAFT_1043327 [Suillus placidus]